MKLQSAARMGDTVVASDAYGTAQVMVGFDPLSYSKIDGVAVRKRQISAAPSVAMPARGVITIDGQKYLVGHGAPDYWRGKAIRVSYVIQGADGLANLQTIGQALEGTAPVTAYAAVVFAKYLPDANDSSRMPPQYQVFLAGAEEAPEDTLIGLEGAFYLVKQSYISTSGLRVALANIVDEPCFETVSFANRVYDPVSDSYTSAGTSIKIFRIKWSESFTYLSKASEGFERGDIQVFMLKSSTPKPSDLLTLSDGSWRILAVQDMGATWRCHARRA